MADINKRKRDNNNTEEEAGTSVGAFTGDTMATALDPFGTAAGAIAGERWTKSRGKVLLMTTIMAQKQEIRIK